MFGPEEGGHDLFSSLPVPIKLRLLAFRPGWQALLPPKGSPRSYVSELGKALRIS